MKTFEILGYYNTNGAETLCYSSREHFADVANKEARRISWRYFVKVVHEGEVIAAWSKGKKVNC